MLIKIAMCKEALVSFLAPWYLMIILELGGEIIPIVQVQPLQSTILVSEEEPHKKTSVMKSCWDLMLLLFSNGVVVILVFSLASVFTVRLLYKRSRNSFKQLPEISHFSFSWFNLMDSTKKRDVDNTDPSNCALFHRDIKKINIRWLHHHLSFCHKSAIK